MISIPIVMFIILLACSIPVVVLLIAWGIMSIIGSIESRKQRKHLEKTECEIEKIILTREKDED